jgi:hypothetical protein
MDIVIMATCSNAEVATRDGQVLMAGQPGTDDSCQQHRAGSCHAQGDIP